MKPGGKNGCNKFQVFFFLCGKIDEQKQSLSFIKYPPRCKVYVSTTGHVQEKK
jgi:hypothetical protein